MESITFTCKIITPMFLNGADGKTPELRPPSIKGALRYWWRAVNGHLGLKELKRQEGEIFGGTDGSGRSKVIVRISHEGLATDLSELVPHKPFMKAPAIRVGQEFTVTLALTRELPYFNRNHLSSIFRITCALGGFGKRVRRGMGSVHILESTDGQSVPFNIELEYIHALISSFSPFYYLSDSGVFFNYSGKAEGYPYIKEIALGHIEKNINTLLRRISNATHDTKAKYMRSYESSMGHAWRGRFASPLYISVLGMNYRIVATTLNPVPDKRLEEVRLLIQEDFKNKIL